MKSKINKKLNGYLAVLISFISFYGNCQSITFVDSLSLKPIIHLSLEIDGAFYYTDSLGIFNFNQEKFNRVNTLHGDYYEESFLFTELQKIDTVKMIRIAEVNLDEIVIIKKKETLIETKIDKKGGFWLNDNNYIASFYENPLKYKTKVKKILVPIRARRTKNGYLIIDFQENKDSNISRKKINKKPIIIPFKSLKNRKSNEIDISEYNIKIPKDGFYISIMVLKKLGTIFDDDYEKLLNIETQLIPKSSFFLTRKNIKSSKWGKFSKDDFPFKIPVPAVSLIVEKDD